MQNIIKRLGESNKLLYLRKIKSYDAYHLHLSNRKYVLFGAYLEILAKAQSPANNHTCAIRGYYYVVSAI